MTTSRRSTLMAAMAAPFAFLSRSQPARAGETPTMSGVRYAAYLAQEVLEFERRIDKRVKAAPDEFVDIYGPQGTGAPYLTAPCRIRSQRHDMIAELPEPDIREWVDELVDPLQDVDQLTMGMGCVVRRCFLERQWVHAPGFKVVGSFAKEMRQFEQSPRPELKPARLVTPRWTADKVELTPRRLAHMVICMYRGLLAELRSSRRLIKTIEVADVVPADAVVQREGPVVDMYAFTDFRLIGTLKNREEP